MYHEEENTKKLEWFQKARFGLFIHWGLYAATEGCWKGKETAGIGEWIVSREKIPMEDYEKFTEKLTCEKFDPKQWAMLARNAGMRYCVFTAKHHEGFAMFDTSYDDYSIVKRTPCGQDVAREVVQAMRNEEIVPCFYYSHALDFHEPEAMGNTWDYLVPEADRDFASYIEGKCKYQLKELLTNYGSVGLVWMDVPKGITKEQAVDLKAYVQQFQPDCLVSGRIHYEIGIGDFNCFGDNQVPAGKPEGVWETAATMNGTWGYKKDDNNFKTVQEILELLCGCLSKGVNLLLNVGPKPDGSLPSESVDILEALGEWYKINGEAINETEASPFPGEFSFGAASCKENVIYLYLYDDKRERKGIDIYGLSNKVVRVSALGGNELVFTQDGHLHLELCKEDYGKYVTVIKVELDGKPVVGEDLFQQEKDHMILPAAKCRIVKTEEKMAKVLLEGDSAIEAENLNLAEEDEMIINRSGVVGKWFSEKNHLAWNFTLEEDGEYDVYLYTLTQKYKEWIGGHLVHVECNEKYSATTSRTIIADRKERSANGKYFGETGSFLGRISLHAGENVLALIADKINEEDAVGLCVSKIVLERRRTMAKGELNGPEI